MKVEKNIKFFLFTLLTMCQYLLYAQPTDPAYKLVLDEQFSSDASNVGTPRFDYYVKDASISWAFPENVNISNGSLNIACKSEVLFELPLKKRNYFF